LESLAIIRAKEQQISAIKLGCGLFSQNGISSSHTNETQEI
jgi:hypothetical protein